MMIPDSENYMVNHSSYIYLFNKKGKFLEHFRYDISVTDLSKKLERLIK